MTRRAPALLLLSLWSTSLLLGACGEKKKDRQAVRDREEDEEAEERARVRKAKSPERICQKLAERENKKRTEQKRPPLEGDQDLKRCVNDLTTMRDERPDQYQCVLPCTDNEQDEKLMDCFIACLLKDPPAAPSQLPSARPTATPSAKPESDPRSADDPFFGLE